MPLNKDAVREALRGMNRELAAAKGHAENKNWEEMRRHLAEAVRLKEAVIDNLGELGGIAFARWYAALSSIDFLIDAALLDVGGPAEALELIGTILGSARLLKRELERMVESADLSAEAREEIRTALRRMNQELDAAENDARRGDWEAVKRRLRKIVELKKRMLPSFGDLPGLQSGGFESWYQCLYWINSLAAIIPAFESDGPDAGRVARYVHIMELVKRHLELLV